MRFIKPWLLIVVLALTACSSGPKKADAPDPGQVPTDVADQPRSALLPPGPPTPNPYLASKPSINRQAQQWFNDAVAAMAKKQWTQAETLLVRLTSQHPNLSGAYLNLGLVYQAIGDAEKAAQAFTQAIAANSNNLDAYNQLGILQRETGDFVGAEEQYRKALAIWPFHPASHRNLGILYDLYMGKGEQALQHYQAYQQLLPEPDRAVNGWIVDLERRLGASEARS